MEVINIWYWFLFLFVDLCMAVLMYKLWGKAGLYATIVASIILCNILVLKTVEIFALVTTLGNILYASIFFATDVLSEVYGKKAARKAVWVGFCAMIMVTVWGQLAIRFVPHASDFAQGSLETIFGMMPRIAAGSLIAYLLSQHFDITAFHWLKRKTSGKLLWLRNCGSTMTSQAIDTTVFATIALLGLFPMEIWLQILLTTYLMKFIVAVFDTPFIYWAKSFERTVKEVEFQVK